MEFEIKNKNIGLVATIGSFDGVHAGHRFLIEKVIQYAKLHCLQSAIITFSNSPKSFFDKDFKLQILSTWEEKTQLLEKTGIDICLKLDFTEKLASLSAKEFIINILHEKMQVKCLFVGYDNRFGKGRIDGYEEYVRYGKEVGMQIIQAPAFLYQENKMISSSSIRTLLKKGNVQEAASLLGYFYNFSGKIIEGYHIGTRIGFPTSNISPFSKEKLIPNNGAYAIYVQIENTFYKGMLNIGNRPTFHSTNPSTSIEAHLFDFSKNIYGQTITIYFVAFLRSEQKFKNEKELTEQLQKDQAKAEAILQFSNPPIS